MWDAVVHSRRAADTLHFPLNRPDMRLETAAEVVKSRFTSSTPLEQQVRVTSFCRVARNRIPHLRMDPIRIRHENNGFSCKTRYFIYQSSLATTRRACRKKRYYALLAKINDFKLTLKELFSTSERTF